MGLVTNSKLKYALRDYWRIVLGKQLSHLSLAVGSQAMDKHLRQYLTASRFPDEPEKMERYRHSAYSEITKLTAEIEQCRKAMQQAKDLLAHNESHDAYNCLAVALQPTKNPALIEDGHGGTWMRCDHPVCDLHVVRPGKVQCSDYCTDYTHPLPDKGQSE